jgi:hypothetical protein
MHVGGEQKRDLVCAILAPAHVDLHQFSADLSELFGHRNEGASALSDGINELSSVGCDQYVFMPLLCSMSM